MAKDKIVISIGDTRFTVIKDNIKEWKYYSHDSIKNKNRSNYMNSRYVYYNHMYHVEYLKETSNTGRLMISFSCSKAFNGNNVIPSAGITLKRIEARLRHDLGDIIQFNSLAEYHNWSISKDETFIDIIDTKDNLKTRMELIKKTYSPYKKNDTLLMDKGTLYIHSGKDRKNSGVYIAVYLKGQEMSSRGESIGEYIPISQDEECLRLEKVSKRQRVRREGIRTKKKLNKMIKNIPTSICYRDLKMYSLFYKCTTIKNSRYINTEGDCVSIYEDRYIGMRCGDNRYVVTHQDIYDEGVVTLGDVLSIEYEKRTILEMLQDLHLDKKILSRGELINLIESNTDIFKSKTVKRTAKRVVRYLNQDDKNTSLSKATISSYRKKILSMGVHYLYTDVKLYPITISQLIDAIDGDGRIDRRCCS